jgi:hypothetical protein
VKDFGPVFMAIADYAIRKGAAPLHRHVGCWEAQVDASWWIAVNGHGTPMATSRGGEMLPPYHAYVEYHGWPAGLLHAGGGVMAAGEAANEETFRTALETG